MSSRCGHTWEAPYALAPGQRVIRFGGVRVTSLRDTVYVKQKCVQPEGHEGPHRSRTNVIAPADRNTT